MNIYPAIDLKSGKCVRLYQGSYEQVTLYANDPVDVAKTFAKQGATVLHVVDLDGAKQGKSENLDLIEKISRESGLWVQTGGGIRTRQNVYDILNKGIARVVLGSIAISQPQEVRKWIHELGSDRIVLALDIRMDANNEPKLALHGWQKPSEKSLWQILDEYQESGLQHVLCTDILCDGTLQGPNINLYKECMWRYPNLHLQASGGVSSLNDLRELALIPVSGVIIGKALYENKFTLSAAFNEVAKSSIC